MKRVDTRIQEIQKMIKGVIDRIEEGRTVDPYDHKIAYAPTGDYFLTYTSGGLKPEGQSIGVWCTSEATALKLLMRNVLEYKSAHPGIIYWRQKPTVHVVTFLRPQENTSPLALNRETTMEVFPMFYGWCRVVISDNPIMAEEDLNKLRGQGGQTLGQPSKDTHRGPSQPNEGRGDSKLEGN